VAAAWNYSKNRFIVIAENFDMMVPPIIVLLKEDGSVYSSNVLEVPGTSTTTGWSFRHSPFVSSIDTMFDDGGVLFGYVHSPS